MTTSKSNSVVTYKLVPYISYTLPIYLIYVVRFDHYHYTRLLKLIFKFQDQEIILARLHTKLH